MSGARWRPVATGEVLRARAALLADIRAFFRRAGVLEVDTPALCRAAATDPAIASLSCICVARGETSDQRCYLHTSPEFAMKRLLAAGSGDIYQMCHVFRDGERGRLHNPEFMLLEWYRTEWDHHRLMDEVAALVRSLFPERLSEQRLSYAEAFRRWCGLDPHRADEPTLRAAAVAARIPDAANLVLPTTDAWLDLLLTQVVEPRLGELADLCFLVDYPESQAALARVRPGEPPVAERFELYLRGVELANGFHELGDDAEQRRRFAADNAQRRAFGLPAMPSDTRLLAALQAGLPDCAGVALGVDRLLLVRLGAAAIDEVMAFPLDSA